MQRRTAFPETRQRFFGPIHRGGLHMIEIHPAPVVAFTRGNLRVKSFYSITLYVLSDTAARLKTKCGSTMPV